MGKTPPVGQKRFTRVASPPILADGVLNRLGVKGIFQFGREDRNAIQEKDRIQTMVGLLAIAELTNNGKQICRVQALKLFVKGARGTKVSKLKGTAGVFDTVP